jgi:hypothetical protein
MCKIMLELQLAKGGMKTYNCLGFLTKFRAKNVHGDPMQENIMPLWIFNDVVEHYEKGVFCN